MSLSAISDSLLTPSTESASAAKPARREASAFQEGSDTPSFWDLIDIVNPLQHIPVVSTIYRAITGDELGQVPRVLGGILFGGPTGLIGAVANAVMQEATGRDIGDTVLAMITGDRASDTMLAENETPKPVNIAWNDPPAESPANLALADGPPVALGRFATASGSQAPAPAPAPAAPDLGALAQTAFAPRRAQLPEAPEPAPEPAVQTPAMPLALASTQPIPLTPKPQDGIVAAGNFVPLAPEILNPAAATATAKDESQPDRFARKPTNSASGQPMGHGKLFAAAAPYLMPRTGADQAKRAVQAQGIEPVNHPMLQAADATGTDAEWMARAMSGALDKYRQGARLQTTR